ncbi:hypothetical protein AAY473_001646 [Plecturocebus cupreus]
MPVIPSLWEAEVGKSPEVRSFETSLANMMEFHSLPRVECNGVISADHNLCLPGSSQTIKLFPTGGGNDCKFSFMGLSLSVVLQSQLTAASNSWTQAILPQSPRTTDEVSLCRQLECNGSISAHCNLYLLGSSDSPASASCVAVPLGTLFRVLLHHPGWRAVVRSWLAATSTFWVQAILMKDTIRKSTTNLDFLDQILHGNLGNYLFHLFWMALKRLNYFHLDSL